MSNDDRKPANREVPVNAPNSGPPAWPGQSSSGVDLTLLISNLRLTPTERLEQNRAAAEFVDELRRGVERARLRKDSAGSGG